MISFASNSPPPPGSLREFFLNRFLPIRLLGCRPNTRSAYETAVNHWHRFESDVPLAAIDSAVLARFAAQCLEIHAAVTVNKQIRHLRTILRFAVREGKLAAWPDFRRLREPKKAPLAFTVEEFSRILAAAALATGEIAERPAAAWWKALLLAIWETGARIRALLAVSAADFDRAAGGLYLRHDAAKNHSDQFLDLSPDTIEALAAIQRPGQLTLFNWRCASDRPARKRFKRICAAAGVPLRNDCGSKFHRIRKSTASYLKLAGGDATARLGHSTPRVTEVYFDPRIVAPQRQAGLLPRPG